MPAFSDRELKHAQIGGAGATVVSLFMGILGAIFLKHGVGLPEYVTCLRNSGWTLLLLSILWFALASWRRMAK